MFGFRNSDSAAENYLAAAEVHNSGRTLGRVGLNGGVQGSYHAGFDRFCKTDSATSFEAGVSRWEYAKEVLQLGWEAANGLPQCCSHPLHYRVLFFKTMCQDSFASTFGSSRMTVDDVSTVLVLVVVFSPSWHRFLTRLQLQSIPNYQFQATAVY